MLSNQIKKLYLTHGIRASATSLDHLRSVPSVGSRQFSTKKDTFEAKDLQIEERTDKLHKPDTSRTNPYTFGKIFTDHMLSIDYTSDKGWHAPKIVPRAPFPLATTATSLHYGISAFEGLAVFKNQKNGKLQGFRVNDNLSSFEKSNAYLDMPKFCVQELLKCVKELVKLDQSWFPQYNDQPGQLYARLAHISTDEKLGVKSPAKTKLYAILNPTTIKSKQLKVKCATDIFKNWPLGHGSYRISGNFGALMPSMVDARNNGFDDVLWLIDDYVKEMTVLNVFMLWKSRFGAIELVTPPNDGCIYNGAIRKSIIELGDEIYKEKGVKVVERQISIHEIISAYKEDRMLEFFGGATSSSIQSISRIGYKDQLVDLSERDPKFTKYLSAKLNGIMTGEDNHQWITPFH